MSFNRERHKGQKTFSVFVHPDLYSGQLTGSFLPFDNYSHVQTSSCKNVKTVKTIQNFKVKKVLTAQKCKGVKKFKLFFLIYI